MERDILKFIQHVGVIKLEKTFQDNNYVYYVLENAPCGTLANFLEQNCKSAYRLIYREASYFKENMITFYLAEMLLILEHLHDHGITHRDFKVCPPCIE